MSRMRYNVMCAVGGASIGFLLWGAYMVHPGLMWVTLGAILWKAADSIADTR
jgi:hypothetical protein